MNARSAQVLAAVLAFLLIVLIGALIFILLSRPAPGPTASPSPTAVAALSPGTSASPSLLPTASLLPTTSPMPSPTTLITPELTPATTPEVTPAITPEITLSPPTPVPTITPPPTPAPTATILIPTSPEREIRFMNMGLDARNETGIQRFLLFTTDGPSLIRADVTNATGNVRVCIWEGDAVEGQDCVTTRPNGTLAHATFEAGTTSWTLTLIGRSAAIGVTADVSLTFNTNAPSVDYDNFRFQGVPAPAYNGLTAAVDTSPGPPDLSVTGQFDGSQAHNWRVLIEEAGVGTVQDQSGGPANSFSVSQAVTAETTYRVTISNPNTSEEPLPVFVHGTIAWP